jgi:hypothetical protein
VQVRFYKLDGDTLTLTTAVNSPMSESGMKLRYHERAVSVE